MKILKVSLLSLVFATVLVMGSAFGVRFFTTDTYVYDDPTFTLLDPSDPLDDDARWDPSVLSGCANSDNLCGFSVTNVSGQTMPSKQVIIDQIKLEYEDDGDTFTHQEVIPIVVNSVTVANATIFLKNVP